MKGTRRAGGNFATTLNTPVVMHTTGAPQHVSKEEVLHFLEKFITEKESFLETSTTSIIDAETGETSGSSTVVNIDTNLTSAVSQLKRLQRDFKGLPPSVLMNAPTSSSSTFSAAVEEPTVDGNGDAVMKSATGGTKKKFSDDD